MSVEAIPDPKHAAMVYLNRALSELEADDSHEAENATLTALAWIRECPKAGSHKPTPSALV